MRKKLFVIGCTGSVGSSVLAVCRDYPDFFEIRALAARSSASGTERLADEFGCRKVVLADERAARELGTRRKGNLTVLGGKNGLSETASDPDIDHVVVASSGTDAVPALLAALRCGKEVSLANKESIIVAGKWIMPLVRDAGQLRPLDSEHNAVWQCLRGRPPEHVEEIVLTASGGPFRTFSLEALEKVTPAMAVSHPVWNMGAKISVDSATLMNKGIEIMEAMQLFALPAEKVQAVVSPDPFVHGIVRFTDGTSLLAASAPDMQIPAASALFFPGICPAPRVPAPPLAGMTIRFHQPDEGLFPCLRIAREAARLGGGYPAVLAGADEAAVNAFLEKRIGFLDIPRVVESVLARYPGTVPGTPEEALSLYGYGRREAEIMAERLEKSFSSRRSH